MILPKKVYSHLGPVSVSYVVDPKLEVGDGDNFGIWNNRRRDIQVATTIGGVEIIETARLQSLLHELVHLALWDAGLTFPNEDAEEAVCDVLGTYMAGAVLNGYLALRVPK